MMTTGSIEDEEAEETQKNNVVGQINPHLQHMKEDILYHINLSTSTHNFKRLFGDVKFICVGGKPSRMHNFAKYMAKQLNMLDDNGLTDYAQGSDRYAVYKVGPVLSVSHGIGIPSMSIVLHEVFKLLHHAGCHDLSCIRIGTSGGLGVQPGTVVITESCVDGMLNNYYEMPILGKLVRRESVIDRDMAQGLLSCANEMTDGYKTVFGATMSAGDFYEGQARIDGAICDYTETDKMNYLRYLANNGVKNIEMEALGLAAMCHRAGIKAGAVCAALLNRLEGDQLTSDSDTLHSWEHRPQQLVAKYIKRKLNI